MKCPKCGAEHDAKFCPECGTASDGTAPQQPVQQQPQIIYQQVVQKKKGGCLKTALIVVVVFVVLIIIIAASSGGSSGGTGSSTSGGSSAASSAESAAAETFYGVGETATANGISMTLNGVTESTGSQYNKPTDGNVFVLCEFTIENNSEKDLSISSLVCFEAYADGFSTNQSLTGLMEANGKNQLDGSVAAGKKMNGIIAYEIPTNWKEMELQVNPDAFSFFSGKTVFRATH